jgi:hypothetical protein
MNLSPQIKDNQKKTMIYAFRNPVPVFGQAHKCGGIKLINVLGNLNTIVHCMGIYHTRFSRYAVRYMVLSENSMKYRFYCQSCQGNYSFEQPHFLTDRSVGRRLFCFTLFITLLGEGWSCFVFCCHGCVI